MVHSKKNFFSNFSWLKLLSILVILTLLGLVIWAIVYQVKERLEIHDPKIIELRTKLAECHPIARKIKFFAGKKSFTVNKKDMTLCLKDENDEYYDDNMLMYVGLHELAHVLCNEIGHTEKFHSIFDSLLEKGGSLGLYDSSIPPVKNYCNSSYHET